jgi:hypothetical protein
MNTEEVKQEIVSRIDSIEKTVGEMEQERLIQAALLSAATDLLRSRTNDLKDLLDCVTNMWTFIDTLSEHAGEEAVGKAITPDTKRFFEQMASLVDDVTTSLNADGTRVVHDTASICNDIKVIIN